MKVTLPDSLLTIFNAGYLSQGTKPSEAYEAAKFLATVADDVRVEKLLRTF